MWFEHILCFSKSKHFQWVFGWAMYTSEYSSILPINQTFLTQSKLISSDFNDKDFNDKDILQTQIKSVKHT